jgi:hypothetical protein
LSCAGTSIGLITSAARMRPTAAVSGTLSVAVIGFSAAAIAARAWSTGNSSPVVSGEGVSSAIPGLCGEDLCNAVHMVSLARVWTQSAAAMQAITQSLSLALDLILSADAALYSIAALSLQVSFSATLAGAAIGLWLGAWLAVARFPGHGAAVWLLNTLLALPSVVVGLVVYLLLSRSGPLGSWGILFTPTAMVIAQSILILPLIAALARRLVLDGLAEGGEQLRSMGAGPLTTRAAAAGARALRRADGAADGFRPRHRRGRRGDDRRRQHRRRHARDDDRDHARDEQGRPALRAGAGRGAARRGRRHQPADHGLAMARRRGRGATRGGGVKRDAQRDSARRC